LARPTALLTLRPRPRSAQGPHAAWARPAHRLSGPAAPGRYRDCFAWPGPSRVAACDRPDLRPPQSPFPAPASRCVGRAPFVQRPRTSPGFSARWVVVALPAPVPPRWRSRAAACGSGPSARFGPPKRFPQGRQAPNRLRSGSNDQTAQAPSNRHRVLRSPSPARWLVQASGQRASCPSRFTSRPVIRIGQPPFLSPAQDGVHFPGRALDPRPDSLMRQHRIALRETDPEHGNHTAMAPNRHPPLIRRWPPTAPIRLKGRLTSNQPGILERHEKQMTGSCRSARWQKAGIEHSICFCEARCAFSAAAGERDIDAGRQLQGGDLGPGHPAGGLAGARPPRKGESRRIAAARHDLILNRVSVGATTRQPATSGKPDRRGWRSSVRTEARAG